MQDDEHNIWEARTEAQDTETNGTLLFIIVVVCFALFVGAILKVVV